MTTAAFGRTLRQAVTRCRKWGFVRRVEWRRNMPSEVPAAATVGIAGLGIMGGAYARSLLAAGFRVIGYDIANEPLEALRSSGGVPLKSARELAEHSHVVITALADPKA